MINKSSYVSMHQMPQLRLHSACLLTWE